MAISWNSTAIMLGLTISGIVAIGSSSVPESRFFFRGYLKSRFFLSKLFKLFFHPPSIFPISSKLSAISLYCLLEINLASQAIWNRNLRVSSTRIQFEILSAFFSFSVKYVICVNSSRSRNLFSIRAPIVKRAVFRI